MSAGKSGGDFRTTVCSGLKTISARVPTEDEATARGLADELEKANEERRRIEKEIESGSFVFKTELEDIHMNIESRLKEIIGEAAGKLHTARSRNDIDVTIYRLYLRQSCLTLLNSAMGLRRVFLDLAAEHHETLIPGTRTSAHNYHGRT